MSLRKVIIIGNNFVTSERVQGIINTMNFDKEIENKPISKDTFDLVKKDNYTLIVIDLPSKADSTEYAHINAYLNTMPPTQIIFISTESTEISDSVKKYNETKSENVITIEPIKIIAFSTLINDLLKIDQDIEYADEENVVRSTNPFVPIKLSLVKRIAKAPCSLHIKLGDKKFVKVIDKDASIDMEILDKYKGKNIDALHIQLEDFYKYSNQFFQEHLIAPELAKNETDFALKSHEALHDIVKDMGINEYTLKTTEKAVNEIAKNIKDEKIGKLFDFFKNSKNQFIYDHSYLTSCLATAICQKMDWSSEKTIEKICMASMLHDFGFKRTRLAMNENLGKVDMNSLSADEKDEVLNHPTIMGELLSQSPDIPSDVVNIVINHHEGRGEESYPKGVYSSNLSQLNCVFIVAHEVATSLYKIAFNFNKLPEVMERLRTMFSAGNTKKSLEALEEIIKEGQGG